MSGYRIQEFATLTGVTLKTLRHYDRVGLLRPRRLPNGFRSYSLEDLERLEQILALKYLGLPLREIKKLLSGPVRDLAETLRAQRIALQAKRHRLDILIQAIEAAEQVASTGHRAPDQLKKIFEVIDMQADAETMRKYYTDDEAWERNRLSWEGGPLPETRRFFAECAALLGEDPSGEPAQALLERWLTNSINDPILTNQTAWMDRNNWPSSMQTWAEELRFDEVTAFFLKASHATRKRYFSDAVWAKLLRLRTNPPVSASWHTRVNFFLEVEKVVDDGAATAERKAELVRRWRQIVDESCAGEPEVKAAIEFAWQDRRNWGAFIRRFSEMVSGMSYERFVIVLDFLDQSISK